MSWNPKTILRYVETYGSSTKPMRVETDDGDAILKVMGNPRGEHVLACEWVGTRLAQTLGLPTFDAVILDVQQDDLFLFADCGYQPKAGPAIATRFVRGRSWDGKAKDLELAVNHVHIARLVVFDTWTRNCDRFGPGTSARINRDNVFLAQDGDEGRLVRLLAIDHTECFTCGGSITPALGGIDRVKDEGLYGLFPEFRDFMERENRKHQHKFRAEVTAAAQRLGALQRNELSNIVEKIPVQWDVNKAAREAMVGFLFDRARYLSDKIENGIWPQTDMFHRS